MATRRTRQPVLATSLVLSALCAAALLAGTAGGGRAAPAAADPVVLAAGDIANCRWEGDEQTAALLAREPHATILTLGDHVYPVGSAGMYEDCYEPNWGRFKERTRPSPGNHDVTAPSTEGGRHYRRYFRYPDYYAFELGSWRIYSLSSERPDMKKQASWLERDLRDHPTRCVLAYWHRPRFSSGRYGTNTRVKPLWEVLAAYGADIVLNGHDQNYQRSVRQRADGSPWRGGTRLFVVGTGGSPLYPINLEKRTPASAVASDSTHGVLRLVLHAKSYEWRFVPVSGGRLVNRLTGNAVRERGRTSCSG